LETVIAEFGPRGELPLPLSRPLPSPSFSPARPLRARGPAVPRWRLAPAASPCGPADPRPAPRRWLAPAPPRPGGPVTPRPHPYASTPRRRFTPMPLRPRGPAPCAPRDPAPSCPGVASRAPDARSVFSRARLCRTTFKFQFNPFFFILV
jgi:hypothetical protein